MNAFSNSGMPQGQNISGTGPIEPVNTIPLSTLIEFMVHKTYHEIMVMADILPSKSDMDRKIQIAQFAHRTRQSYVRLLALVKWANSIGKVTKCGEITTFLDQQASLFIDTADKLHTLANQLVVQARLPNFSIPAAIDVLTTGTYPRLPKCIRDKIIPPDPITDDEKNVTLKRLNQIIMYNLVTTDIPPQFSELIVKKGMVQLVVVDEFKVFLTLMSDEPNDPWILLKLEILVKDKHIGGGKKLVHDMQIDYLHKLVQSRIIGNDSPFNDMYNLLHTFCLSLEIEVLQAQAVRLATERWGGLFQIEEYLPGQKITIAYWKWNKHKALQTSYQVSIVQHMKNDNRILKVVHTPPLSMKNISLVEKASKLNSLSIEQLLSDTIAVRSYQKLMEIKDLLQKHIKNDCSRVDDSQCSLTIPLLNSTTKTESMILSIDPHTGMFVPFVSETGQGMLDDIEKAINSSLSNILTWISKLKINLAIKQCEAVLQTQKTCSISTPLLADTESHPIMGKLSDAVLYIKLTKFSGYYIVVEILHDNPLELEYKYYLLYATSVKNPQSAVHSMRLKIHGCMQLYVDEDFDEITAEDKEYVKTSLLNVIAITLVRIPYIKLLEELNAEEIVHQGILDEGGSTGLCLKMLSFPKIDCNAIVQKHLQNSLLECVFRYNGGDEKSWNVELVFCDRPFKTEKQENDLTRVILPLDTKKVASDLSTYKRFTLAWQNIARLHGPVMQFAQVLKDHENNLRNSITVYSYTYTALQLKYGFNNGKQMLLTIRWSAENNKFLLQFGKASPINGSAHIFSNFYLNNMFNVEKDIGKLMQVLLDTIEPIQLIYSLPIIPVLGMTGDYQTSVQQKNVAMNFTVIPQSATHFRVTFRELYAIDVFCMPNKTVAIRDGALSQFESIMVKEGLNPIPGLQAFLNFYDDKNIQKFVATERDDPPSPDNSKNSVPPTEMKEIPKGVWCGNTPKLLNYQIFGKIVKPSNAIKPGAQYAPSYLEMFLGYTIILRTLRHELLKNNESHYLIPNDRADSPTSLVFACHTLHYTFGIMFYPNGLQLSLSINQVPVNILQERGLNPVMWPNDELRLMEKFFQTRVASSPFRALASKSFFTMISSPGYILQNFIRIMQMELSGMTHEPNIKWLPRLCLTIPPKLSFFNNAGVPSIHHVNDKVVVFCEFVPNALHQQGNMTSIVLPFIWNLQNNLGPGSKPLSTLQAANSPLILKLNNLLKTLNESITQNQEINLVSAIHFVAKHF